MYSYKKKVYRALPIPGLFYFHTGLSALARNYRSKYKYFFKLNNNKLYNGRAKGSFFKII